MKKLIKKLNYQTGKIIIKTFLKLNTPRLTQKMLFANMGGHSMHLNREGIFANALRLRGCDISFLICDGVCEACARRNYIKNDSVDDWKNICKNCTEQMIEKLNYYNIKPLFASDFISENKKREFNELVENINVKDIFDFQYENMNIGQIAWQSFLRYMRGLVSECDNVDEKYVPMYKRFLYAGLVVSEIANNVLNKVQPDNLFSPHALYTDYTPLIKIAKKRGIKAVCWIDAWGKFVCYFYSDMSFENTNLLKIKDENWSKLVQRKMTQDEIDSIDNYFVKRYAVNSDISVDVFDSSDKSKLEEFRFDNDKKTGCLFCHINWDAAIDPNGMPFKTPDEWLVESIKHMIKNDSVNWIIRIHPAELISNGIITAYGIIQENFDIEKLPEHIKIMNSDKKINTKDIYEIIDFGITIFSTVGLELPFYGKNIIVAGTPHYAGKGFTIDAKSREEYFKILDNVQKLPELSPQQIELAKKYAFSFFIQREIPLGFMYNKEKDKTGWQTNMQISKLANLLPNRNSIIDKICNGIMNEDDVILELEDLKHV